jgi:hypothetical protein
MKRLFAGLTSLVLLAFVAGAGACDDGPRRHEMRGGGYGNPQCGQYATCGTCTPALGCGWCMTGASAGASSGLCVDDPGDCPAATTLGWTWEPTGCHAGTSDASVLAEASVASDAGDTGDDASRDAGSQSFDAQPDSF